MDQNLSHYFLVDEHPFTSCFCIHQLYGIEWGYNGDMMGIYGILPMNKDIIGI